MKTKNKDALLRDTLYLFILAIAFLMLVLGSTWSEAQPPTNRARHLSDRLITVDYAHHEIHDGTHFVAFHNAPLGNGGTYQLLINTPTASIGNIVHLIIQTRGSAESNIVFYEGTTVSNSGSALAVVNRNRNVSRTADTVVTLGPTITSLGSVMIESHFGSGPQVGGEDRDSNEWNLAPDTLYLINATSEAASNDLSVKADFYEDNGDAP